MFNLWSEVFYLLNWVSVNWSAYAGRLHTKAPKCGVLTDKDAINCPSSILISFSQLFTRTRIPWDNSTIFLSINDSVRALGRRPPPDGGLPTAVRCSRAARHNLPQNGCYKKKRDPEGIRQGKGDASRTPPTPGPAGGGVHTSIAATLHCCSAAAVTPLQRGRGRS